VAAYDPEAWTDLYVAVAGATAALAGLLFVAVSINLERIVAEPNLPERALETLLLLVGALLLAVAVLVPGQSDAALGVEIALVGGAFCFVIARLWRRRIPQDAEPQGWREARLTLLALGTLPQVIGGLSLIAGAGGGLYWVVAGIAFAILGAVANAWVLLVEILR
jgi:hypothetical protein